MLSGLHGFGLVFSSPVNRSTLQCNPHIQDIVPLQAHPTSSVIAVKKEACMRLGRSAHAIQGNVNRAD